MHLREEQGQKYRKNGDRGPGSLRLKLERAMNDKHTQNQTANPVTRNLERVPHAVVKDYLTTHGVTPRDLLGLAITKEGDALVAKRDGKDGTRFTITYDSAAKGITAIYVVDKETLLVTANEGLDRVELAPQTILEIARGLDLSQALNVFVGAPKGPNALYLIMTGTISRLKIGDETPLEFGGTTPPHGIFAIAKDQGYRGIYKGAEGFTWRHAKTFEKVVAWLGRIKDNCAPITYADGTRALLTGLAKDGKVDAKPMQKEADANRYFVGGVAGNRLEVAFLTRTDTGAVIDFKPRSSMGAEQDALTA